MLVVGTVLVLATYIIVKRKAFQQPYKCASDFRLKVIYEPNGNTVIYEPNGNTVGLCYSEVCVCS